MGEIKDNKIKVLLIEDNPDHIKLIETMCIDIKKGNIALYEAKRIQEAKEIIKNKPIDIVLLDLTLTESQGIDTVKHFKEFLEEIPFIILTVLEDDLIELQTLKEGIQDYLVKGDFNYNLLWRSITYSIERHKLLSKLRDFALFDELTGLYNRRGFFNFLERQIKISERSKDKFHLAFADLDKLKIINDTYGHTKGDEAIVSAANVLRKIFRGSDIIARIGGDEYAIIIAEGDKLEDTDSINRRLQEAIASLNKTKKHPFDLSISIGMTIYNPANPITIEKLISEADNEMYKIKSKKKEKYSKN